MSLRRLTLVRHAKADWKDSKLSDFDRPLNPKGLKEAPDMAKRVADAGVRVDLLLSSPAARALATARIFAKALDYPLRQLESEEQLYLATPGVILEVVRRTPVSVQHLMVVGHNPGLSEFALALTNDTELGELPTCAVYTMELEIPNWNAAKFGLGTNAVLSHPKNLLGILG